MEIWKRPLSTLCEVISESCLPEEYGGTERSIKELRSKFYQIIYLFNILSIFFFIILTIIGELYDTLEEFKVWFEEQDELIADLTKKSRSTSTDGLSCGLDGSFRKLCVD